MPIRGPDSVPIDIEGEDIYGDGVNVALAEP
jgi:hypothetical protein